MTEIPREPWRDALFDRLAMELETRCIMLEYRNHQCSKCPYLPHCRREFDNAAFASSIGEFNTTRFKKTITKMSKIGVFGSDTMRVRP